MIMSKPTYLLLLSTLMTATLSGQTRYYQSKEAADSAYSHWDEEWMNLDQVVVTGTRTPKLLKDVPIQTRLITAQDIQMVDATNVEDLLQQELPGVEFSQAMNQQTHMNFSGFGGQSVLFLVDGERLAGETQDDVDFTRLNMANVERIEIVKGAASALYGSNAAGGVINVITKEPTEPWTLNVNMRVSKHKEKRFGVALGMNGHGVQNQLSVTGTSIDDFAFESGKNPVAVTVKTFWGDKTLNVKDHLTWRPLEGLLFTGRAGYFYREQVRSETIPERYRAFTGGLRGNWDITDHDRLEVSYNFDQYDKSDYFKQTQLDLRDYSNVQNSLRLLYNHTWEAGNVLTLGSDYMHDYLLNNLLLRGSEEQDSFDFFGQFDWRISQRWEVLSALRYDYFSDAKQSRVTPKFSVRYHPQKNLNLRLGYGMGFRAPSLKEKYYRFDMLGIWIIQGNPDLQPEVSHNFNASVEYTKSNYNMTVGGYYNRLNNRLATGAPYMDPKIDPSNPDQLYLDYVNLADYSTFGFDVTLQARWNNGLGLKTSYAFVHEQLPYDKQGESINNQYIPARAHSLLARVDWDHQFRRNYGLNVSLNGRALSGVDNDEFVDYVTRDPVTNRLLKKTIHYNPYTLWKLSFIQRLGSAVRLTLAVDNLFNYTPDYYYLNAPLTDGATLQIGLSIDIDKF